MTAALTANGRLPSICANRPLLVRAVAGVGQEEPFRMRSSV